MLGAVVSDLRDILLRPRVTVMEIARATITGLLSPCLARVQHRRFLWSPVSVVAGSAAAAATKTNLVPATGPGGETDDGAFAFRYLGDRNALRLAITSRNIRMRTF